MMAVGTLERILEEVRTVSDEEKARLREELDVLLAEGAQRRKEDEFQQRLHEQGVIAHLPARVGVGSERIRRPIKYQGKPVSETLIEERR